MNDRKRAIKQSKISQRKKGKYKVMRKTRINSENKTYVFF
jgi:hypothetical protein